MRKISRWGLGFLIALSLGLNFYLLQKVKIFKQNENTFEVVKVLDGDSFVIPPDQSIRLANLDAPELKYCFGQEAKENLEKLILGNLDAPELKYCFGQEAKENLEKLILGKRVKIVKVGVDNFRRLIAIVYLGDQLVNETVLASG